MTQTTNAGRGYCTACGPTTGHRDAYGTWCERCGESLYANRAAAVSMWGEAEVAARLVRGAERQARLLGDETSAGERC